MVLVGTPRISASAFAGTLGATCRAAMMSRSVSSMSEMVASAVVIDAAVASIRLPPGAHWSLDEKTI